MAFAQRTALIAAVAAVAGPAAAGQPPAGTAPATAGGMALLDNISACRRIAEAATRLQCFDRAAATLDQGRADRGLVVMDKTEVREKRKSLFGFALPRINLFGRDSDAPEEEITEINSKLAGVAPSGRDRWTLRLEDRSTWRTIEASRFDPSAGDTIRIRRAALGSYLANIDGKRAVRIERVE